MNLEHPEAIAAALAPDADLTADAAALLAIYGDAAGDDRLRLPGGDLARQWLEGCTGILREVARRRSAAERARSWLLDPDGYIEAYCPVCGGEVTIAVGEVFQGDKGEKLGHPPVAGDLLDAIGRHVCEGEQARGDEPVLKITWHGIDPGGQERQGSTALTLGWVAAFTENCAVKGWQSLTVMAGDKEIARLAPDPETGAPAWSVDGAL
jgi:hypothetical protein